MTPLVAHLDALIIRRFHIGDDLSMSGVVSEVINRNIRIKEHLMRRPDSRVTETDDLVFSTDPEVPDLSVVEESCLHDPLALVVVQLRGKIRLDPRDTHDTSDGGQLGLIDLDTENFIEFVGMRLKHRRTDCCHFVAD
jgi:hypothetical protein